MSKLVEEKKQTNRTDSNSSFMSVKNQTELNLIGDIIFIFIFIYPTTSAAQLQVKKFILMIPLASGHGNLFGSCTFLPRLKPSSSFSVTINYLQMCKDRKQVSLRSLIVLDVLLLWRLLSTCSKTVLFLLPPRMALALILGILALSTLMIGFCLI